MTHGAGGSWASSGNGRFRLPGARAGKLGLSDARFVTSTNPFGLDVPTDPRCGQDPATSSWRGQKLHLPLGRPVHDAAALERRAARLLRTADPRPHEHGAGADHLLLVPPAGRQVRHPLRCSYGVGHTTCAATWLWRIRLRSTHGSPSSRPSTTTLAKSAPPMAAAPGTAATPTPETTVASGTDLVEQGQALAQSKGCVACH